MLSRLAGSRLLAERPVGIITEDIAEHLQALTERMEYGKSLEVDVGPQIMDRTNNMPLQMKMKLMNSPVDAPFDVDRYIQEQIGIVPGIGGALDVLESAPNVREISFGWHDPTKRSGMSFKTPTDPSAKQAIKELGMQELLKAAQLKLMDRAGMSAGDLLVNTPVGLADGNYKRTKTYMAQGFGAPDASSGQMYGKITGDGSLSPVQIYSAEPTLMENLKWHIDNEALKRASAALYFQ